MTRDAQLHVRLAASDVELLDQLARDRGQSRSALVRDLVAEASGQPRALEAAPDLQRVLSAVAQRAYEGNVEAAKLVFAMVGRPTVRPSTSTGTDALLVQLDELRRRRGDVVGEPLAEKVEQRG